MAKAMRKTLPKDFEERLERGDIRSLQAVFDVCSLDARGGYAKQTALAFDACPDSLARWLVARGADLSAADTWGNTPLHARSRSGRGRIGVLLELGADVANAGASVGTPLHAAADSHNAANARLLLEHGADPDAVDRDGLTPLDRALQTCRNIDIVATLALAECLLAAGATRSKRTAELVAAIGKEFEFHRANFDPDTVDETSGALRRLAALFGVAPAAPRQVHDGRSGITVRATKWQQQLDELWQLLVPSSGAAATVQGEVIRIASRIATELDGNGGANWDGHYKQMADAWLGHVSGGWPLPEAERAEAAAIVAQVKRKNGDTHRMAELAVRWVLANREPVALPPPAYDR